MSARIPPRRLGQSVLAALHPRPTRWVPATSLPLTAQRSISNPFKPKDKDLSNPLLEKYLMEREVEEGLAAGDKDKKPERPPLREGRLPTDPSSFLAPEREIPGWHPNMSKKDREALLQKIEAQETVAKAQKEKELVNMNLDPDPHARRKVERKLVIQGVKRHGRMTKAQTIARTERESLYKSQNLPTSTKKMQKVVNQLAGKTVSEALVQLRFSPKRIARDVIKGLEIAQNEAIVGRGMGLGGGHRAQKRWEAQRARSDLPRSTRALVEKPNHDLNPGPAKIELKDGSKKIVSDPSEIYIDQVWVGKGEMWMSPEYRARGAVNMLRHRTTSFSVVLKEEKTRMRLSDEIKKKRDNRKLWTALPDRPVTSQRQYCLW